MFAKKEKTLGQLYQDQINLCNIQMGLAATGLVLWTGLVVSALFGSTIGTEWNKHIVPLFQK